MELDSEHLPATLVEVAEVIGLAPTLHLVEHLGGTRVYVPENMPVDHILVRVIGHKAAWLLAERFGRETLSLARCVRAVRAVRDAEIRRKRDGGAKPAHLALHYGLTERQVYTILAAGEPEDSGQQALL